MTFRSAAASGRSADRHAVTLSALFIAFAVLCLLRVALIPTLLDRVMTYTADEGNLVEKIHPTLYGFVAVGLWGLLTTRIELTAWELRVLRHMFAFLGGMALLLLGLAITGRLGSSGYLIDSYLTACCAALMILFPPPWRRGIATVLIGYLVAGAVIGIGEFATHIRLLPYAAKELTFRPTGLSNHPLEFGLVCAMAVGFVAATDWRPLPRALAMAVLVVGGFAAGARLAAIVGLLSAFLVVLVKVGAGQPRRRVLERRIIAVVAALVTIPILLGGLYAAGALQRFQGGLIDESALARVDIYGVFRFLSWNEILFGTDVARVRQIALEQFGYAFIESSLVIFVVQFGAIGTALFLGLLANLVRVMLSGARLGVVIGTFAFFVIATSNNGLSTKNAGIFLLFTLILALRPEPQRNGGMA